MPVVAESAARATGTYDHIELNNNIFDGYLNGLTAIHGPREETDSFSLHTLCSSEKLHMTMSLFIYFEAEKKRVEELHPDNC